MGEFKFDGAELRNRREIRSELDGKYIHDARGNKMLSKRCVREEVMVKIVFSIFFCLFTIVSIASAEIIDVNIKGIDDGRRTNRQQDYREAVMNAKLQAIEQAGASIESITQVVNFQLKYDAVESKSKAILLPGFQVIDIGYIADGTYQVVLIGKIQTSGVQQNVPHGGQNQATIKSGSQYKWIYVGKGDCGGMDYTETYGSSMPNAGLCNQDSMGKTAVCWDMKQTFTEANRVFCTYKNVRPSSCTGGHNIGSMYSCGIE